MLPLRAATARLEPDLAVVLRRVVVERLLATGVTSTVALEAAGSAVEETALDAELVAAPAEALAVVDVVEAAAAAAEERRRGAGDAMGKISDGWNGGTGRDQLSIRHPVVDDSTDRQIRENSAVGTGKSCCRATGGEHPVALPCSDRINGNELFAFVVPENTQMHVIQPRDAIGADKGSHDLHDLHQEASPGLGVGEGLEVAGAEGTDDDALGGSTSQWSMIPTMVRSLG